MAAQSIAKMVNGHCMIVLDVLKKHGDLTPEQITHFCNLRYDQVWRRTSDLVRLGLAKKGTPAQRQTNSSGREADVLVAV